jgi:hypothetical protein
MQTGGGIRIGQAGEKIIKGTIFGGFLVENLNGQVFLPPPLPGESVQG